MTKEPLRKELLQELSDLDRKRADLLRNGDSKVADIIKLADIDDKIKITKLKSTIAKSTQGCELLSKFKNDNGRIEFISPRDGYLVRSELSFDVQENAPVISLSPENRNYFDMAVAVSECLKAHSLNHHMKEGTFESYDSETEEMLSYEDKYAGTSHPTYQKAKEFGKVVAREIKTYNTIRAVTQQSISLTTKNPNNDLV